MSNYQYPIDPDWTTEEIVMVIDFLNIVEQAYEASIMVERFDDQYQRFKEVIPSISGQKKIDRQFEEVSGYSIYKLVQYRKSLTNEKKLSMK